MKRLFLTGVAALFLATGTAFAGSYDTLPPTQYDYLFPGPIVITRKSTSEELAEVCGGKKLIGGCAARVAYVCQIFLLNDEWLRRLGLTFKAALRHEIGHCNGWGADHANVRSVAMCEGAHKLGADCPLPWYGLNPDQTFTGPSIIDRFLELGKRRLKEMENK